MGNSLAVRALGGVFLWSNGPFTDYTTLLDGSAVSTPLLFAGNVGSTSAAVDCRFGSSFVWLIHLFHLMVRFIRNSPILHNGLTGVFLVGAALVFFVDLAERCRL